MKCLQPGINGRSARVVFERVVFELGKFTPPVPLGGLHYGCLEFLDLIGNIMACYQSLQLAEVFLEARTPIMPVVNTSHEGIDAIFQIIGQLAQLVPPEPHFRAELLRIRICEILERGTHGAQLISQELDLLANTLELDVLFFQQLGKLGQERFHHPHGNTYYNRHCCSTG